MSNNLEKVKQAIIDVVPEMKIALINNDYFIDTYGNVYSRPRWRVLGGILAQKISPHGYKIVKLSINNKKYTKQVHRLIAEAFIPNPSNKPEVNHINGNKLDNSIKNLEWVTSAENNSHAWANNLQKRKSASGERYIYVDKQTGRYRVVINHNNIGRFVTLNEAIIAREFWFKTSPFAKTRSN